eukprot:1141061-Pelagomonas_calceolata.AAC.2
MEVGSMLLHAERTNGFSSSKKPSIKNHMESYLKSDTPLKDGQWKITFSWGKDLLKHQPFHTGLTLNRYGVEASRMQTPAACAVGAALRGVAGGSVHDE